MDLSQQSFLCLIVLNQIGFIIMAKMNLSNHYKRFEIKHFIVRWSCDLASRFVAQWRDYKSKSARRLDAVWIFCRSWAFSTGALSWFWTWCSWWFHDEKKHSLSFATEILINSLFISVNDVDSTGVYMNLKILIF